MSHKMALLCVLFSFTTAQRQYPDFPTLNQQCQDDAGPRWIDDIENFGTDKFYWSNSHAQAVLNQDGSCAEPVEAACRTRTNPLQAYIEGPISCPDAWFCRIYPDPNHGSKTDFLGDRNYGDCDKSTWEETDTDQDGHCHGGMDPSSYYWWVRDHWNRPYSGRVKCCCVDSMEIANTNPPRRTMDLRGIANRCDYRAVVTVGADNCRDANEDHEGGRMGSGFRYGFDGPCPLAADGRTVAYVREPADEMCWEILNFGIPDDGDNDPSITATSTGPCTGAGRATRGSCNGDGNFSGVNAGPYVNPNGAPLPTFGPEVTFTYAPEPTQPAGGNTGTGGNDNGDNGEVGEEPEEESESEDESENESEDSQVVFSQTSTCPSSRHLRDANECRLAAESLGLVYRSSFRRTDRPVGCYFRNNKAWFNQATSGTDGSSDRRSICCTSDNCAFDEVSEDDDEEEELSESENRYMKSSSGSCPEGTSYITEEDKCVEAAEFMGLELERTFSNSRRPRGCYTRKGKAFFNRNERFTTRSSQRKSICIRN